MLKKKVLETITEYQLINGGEHVVLGLSGGPDSVCLFHVLKSLENVLGFTLHCAHVNHMMREETNFRDEKFVQRLCEENGVSCDLVRVDCLRLAAEKKITSEEAGRMARYDFFRKVSGEFAKDGRHVSIAVAHNADDQAETLLFRIMRGTGTDGLAGIEHRRTEGDYELIRPLLDVTRKEIENYIKDNGLEFVTDETNRQAIYARNRIRLELIPYMRANFNENISASLNRLAKVAACDKNYLWQQAEKAYYKCLYIGSNYARADDALGSDYLCFDQKMLSDLHEAIRHRVLLKALKNVGLSEDISSERLSAIDDIIKNSTQTRIIQLPRGYRVTAAFGKVTVKKDAPETDLAEIETELVTEEEAVDDVISQLARGSHNAGVVILDADALCKECGVNIERLRSVITVRLRREGDYICLNGGRKKIRKLLAEMKIPADERSSIYLAAVGNCILAIADARAEAKSHADGAVHLRRFAEKFKVTNKTKAVIKVKFV